MQQIDPNTSAEFEVTQTQIGTKEWKRAFKVMSGCAHPVLAQKICDHIGIPLGKVTVDSFPDGETFIKIDENVRGQDIFIVQPTCPVTNHNLMELLIMVDAVKRASASRITAVIPFYGYARQDRKDQPRVPITAKLVANLLVAAGVNRVLTLDLHAQQIQGFFDIPVDHLYAGPELIRHIRTLNLDNLVVVSPDVGGIKMTQAFAKALKADFAIVAKNRLSATSVQAISTIGEVKDRNVLLVDDMTQTAGTLSAAAVLLKEQGARRILAVVTHAVLGDLAKQRLKDSAIEQLICTDSVPQAVGDKVTIVSVAGLLGEAIVRIHNNRSVTSLFNIED